MRKSPRRLWRAPRSRDSKRHQEGCEHTPHPGWIRRPTLGRSSQLASSMTSIYGRKQVVIVRGRDDKAQQLGCKVVLRLCQGQLHNGHTHSSCQPDNSHQVLSGLRGDQHPSVTSTMLPPEHTVMSSLSAA